MPRSFGKCLAQAKEMVWRKKEISFLPAAKPTGHSMERVVLLGKTTFSHPCKLFLGVFWSQDRERNSALLLLFSPSSVLSVNEHTYIFRYISPTVILFLSYKSLSFLTNQTPQVNEQILFLFWGKATVFSVPRKESGVRPFFLPFSPLPFPSFSSSSVS